MLPTHRSQQQWCQVGARVGVSPPESSSVSWVKTRAWFRQTLIIISDSSTSVLEMFYFVNFLSLEQYYVHFQNWVKIERQFKFFRIYFNKKAYSSSSLKSHFLESLLTSWCVFQSLSKVSSLSHYSGHTNPYGPIIRWLILCLWGVLVIDINNSKVWWTPRLCLNKTSQYKVVIRLISTDSNITNSNPGCWSDSAIITNNFHQPQPHTLHQTNYYSLTFHQPEPACHQLNCKKETLPEFWFGEINCAVLSWRTFFDFTEAECICQHPILIMEQNDFR